jgi:hypothetical protein
MRANDLDVLAPRSRRAVRDFCRRTGNDSSFTPEAVIGHFGADVTNELLANDVIEPARKRIYSRHEEEKDGEIIAGHYRLTRRGRRMAHVRLQNPIPRAKGDEVVADLLKRALTINRNRALLCYVRRITVVGSYLTDSPDLGDVDIGVDIDRKIDCYEKFQAKASARARAIAPFRYFCCSFEYADFMKREVLLLLKNRSRYISLIRDYEYLDTPKRVIFSDKKRTHQSDCMCRECQAPRADNVISLKPRIGHQPKL